MRPEDDDAARVWDMVTYARTLVEMARGRTYGQFTTDAQFRLAAERCVEIIGEAAGHVSQDFRSRRSDVAWPQIVGLRNIIVHGYAQLDHKKLWNVIENDLPRLLESLSPLLEDLEQQG